jgi:hypothetical protein
VRTVFFILLAGNLLLAGWLVMDRSEPEPGPPPVPDDVPRLKLLSEREGTPLMSSQQDGEEELDNGTPRVCWTLGPFETEADARAVSGRLEDGLLNREIRRSQTEDEIGHWVYLPAMPSRDRALEVARELSERGLSDYYVVTTGDQENTISLGLYEDQQNAESRLASLRNMGFDAEMRPRTESVPRYWLDIAVSADDMRDWSEFPEDYPDVTASETDCPA